MFTLQPLLLNSSINSLPPPEFLEEGAIPSSLITICALDLLGTRSKNKETIRQTILLRKDNTFPLPHLAWLKAAVFSLERYNINSSYVLNNGMRVYIGWQRIIPRCFMNIVLPADR